MAQAQIDLPPLPRPLTRGSIPPDFKIFEADTYGKLTIKKGPADILEEHPDLNKHPVYNPDLEDRESNNQDGENSARTSVTITNSVQSSSYRANKPAQGDETPKPEGESDYDTDLEDNDDRKTHFAREDKNEHLYLTYQRECKSMSVVPCSSLLNRKGLELNKIDLSNRYLGPKPICALAKALTSNACVSELIIPGNAIGWLGSHSIFEMLQDNYFITTLNLSNNDIPATVFDTLQTSILENPGTLQHLSLSNCCIDDEGIDKFSSILLDSRLQSLDLSKNPFGNNVCAMRNFSHAIEENASLTVLNLSGINSVIATRKNLIAGLTQNIFLVDVDLSNCGFGGNEQIAEGLGKYIELNETVERLNLGYNMFVDSLNQLENISNGLKTNKTLKYFDMSGNSIHSNDAMKSNITGGNIPQPSPPKEGILKIVKALADNPDTAIEELNFDKIYAGQDFQRYIQEHVDASMENGGVVSIFSKIKIITGEVSAKSKPKAIAKVNPMLKLKNWLSEHDMTLNSFFCKLDDDDSMTLSYDEFEMGIREYGIPLDTDEITELIAMLDLDGDGDINYA